MICEFDWLSNTYLAISRSRPWVAWTIQTVSTRGPIRPGYDALVMQEPIEAFISRLPMRGVGEMFNIYRNEKVILNSRKRGASVFEPATLSEQVE